jgi:hypothetical protein
MKLRNIRPFKFIIYDSDFGEWIGVNFSDVTQIFIPSHLHELAANQDALIQIINSCHKLHSFESNVENCFVISINASILSQLTTLKLTVDHHLMSITLKHLTEHCHSLINCFIFCSFDIHFVGLLIISSFLKCNPNLETVELNFILQNFDQSFISFVLLNCLNLSSFKIRSIDCDFRDVSFLKDVLSTERIKYFKLGNNIDYIFDKNGKHLTLNYCYGIPTTQFVTLFSHCASITHLKLEYFDFYDGDIIQSIVKYCTQLESIAIELGESNMRIDVLKELFLKCNLLKVFSIVGGENTLKNDEVLELFQIPNQIAHVTFNIQNYNDASSLLIDILKANPQITHFDCHRWCEDRKKAFKYLQSVGRWIYL